MASPLVSVILPAYNGAGTIGAAITSVLEQTYGNWELLVTDDCSTDRTRELVRQVIDPRVRLIEHRSNSGPDAARFTAIAASTGDLIAFLDQDDLFLPGKLAAHAALMARQPGVGLSYNPFYLVTEPGHRVEAVSCPPEPLTLADLVAGFPLPPSTWVFRRRWALFDDIWDPATMLRGREVVLLGRLFVSGCRFGLVDEVLNVRRVHRGRTFAAPALKCAEERRCQEIMLADARCDAEACAVRERASAETCLTWANVALAQHDTAAGLDLLGQALELEPSFSIDPPRRLAEFFLGHAVTEALDPEAQIDGVFRQAAPLVPGLASQREWAVTQAHLILAARHVLWDRHHEATRHWERLRILGAVPDDAFVRRAAHEILLFERVRGQAPARRALRNLGLSLSRLGGPALARRLAGAYRLSRAFVHYGRGDRKSVPHDVMCGLLNDPREIANRGAWSLLLRSALAR